MTLRGGPVRSSSAASSAPGWRAEDFQRFVTNYISEGVVPNVGGELEVAERSSGANMSVDVAAGLALVEVTTTLLSPNATLKTWLESDAVVNVQVPAADATNARKDRIVAQFDMSVDPNGSASDNVSIELVEGTPSGSPSAPATPSNAISLAVIDVPASDTSISNSQITDDRSYADAQSTAFALLARATETVELRNDTPSWGGTSSGTAPAYSVAPSPAFSAYTSGMRIAFKVHADTTGATTIDVNGLGAKSLLGPDGLALVAGDILQDGLVEARYNGTAFVMTSPKHSSAAGGNQEIIIWANELAPDPASPCAAFATTYSTTNFPVGYLGFNSATFERAFALVPIPADFVGSTMKARAIWGAFSGAASGGNVVWEFSLTAVGDSDSYDTSLGTGVTVTDGLDGDYDIMHSAQSADITIANSPAAGDLMMVRVGRRGAEAADSVGTDARLLAIVLDYS